MNKSKVEALNSTDHEADSFIIKLLQNRSLLINILFAILFFGLILGIISSKMSRRQTKNASMAYASLNQQDQLEPHADIFKLIKIANKHPFLRAHLDAPLAQECLNRGEVKLAANLHQRVKSRLLPHLEFLFKFNKISFLISEGNYQEALQLSYGLKDEINSRDQPTLYSYHILRTANLEKQLGHLEESKDHLNEFVSFISDTGLERDTLKMGELSLIDFVSKKRDL